MPTMTSDSRTRTARWLYANARSDQHPDEGRADGRDRQRIDRLERDTERVPGVDRGPSALTTRASPTVNVAVAVRNIRMKIAILRVVLSWMVVGVVRGMVVRLLLVDADAQMTSVSATAAMTMLWALCTAMPIQALCSRLVG